jgi:hypothetical protein
MIVLPLHDLAPFTPCSTLPQVADRSGPIAATATAPLGTRTDMTPEETFARRPKRSAEQDLSGEIVSHVEKLPGDQVRCTAIGNGNYRCNWWAPQATRGYDNPAMGGLLVTTHRVRKSRLLRAAKDGDRLVVEEVPLR